MRLLFDSNFHISLVVAIIACGATYKYWIRPRIDGKNRAEDQNDWPELEEELAEDEIWAEDDRQGVDIPEEQWERYEDFFNGVPLQEDQEGGIPRPANHREINPTPADLEQAGPSRTKAKNRKIGAKKAKSIARRDRVRAYNEYMQQQGAAQRYEQKEFEEQFGDLIAAERAERDKREREARQQLKEKQQMKRIKEEEERKRKEDLRADLERKLNETSRVKLSTDEEKKLASTISHGAIVSNGNWLVKLDDADLKMISDLLREKSKLSYKEIAEALSR